MSYFSSIRLKVIYIFKIRKLQSCRVLGTLGYPSSRVPTAVTSELHCSQSSTSLWGWGGLTAVTSEPHCRQSSTSLGGGSNCSHFRTSLQIKFNFTLGGGFQLQSLQNFTADKLQLHFGGAHCSHFRTSLHTKFNFTSGGCPGDVCPEH